ncbi:MAG: hypothetical protein CMM94_03945 [Rickettsiales bacterium]|nr:hypothetical protein [Rickettsiales bacterium]
MPSLEEIDIDDFGFAAIAMKRIGAFWTDMVIFGIFALIVGLVLESWTWPLIAPFAYYMLFSIFTGRGGGTFGTELFGLKLYPGRRDGSLGLPGFILWPAHAYLAVSLTLVTAGLSWLLLLFRKDRRTLHDILLGVRLATEDMMQPKHPNG